MAIDEVVVAKQFYELVLRENNRSPSRSPNEMEKRFAKRLLKHFYIIKDDFEPNDEVDFKGSQDEFNHSSPSEIFSEITYGILTESLRCKCITVDNKEFEVLEGTYEPEAAKTRRLNFNDLSRITSLDETRRRNNAQIMECVLQEYVIPALKKDALFNTLYRTICYTGSYYDRLKTIETDEFDLNIVLHLPFKDGDVQICPKAGYAEYYLRQKISDLFCKDPRWDVLQKLEILFDNRYLSPEKTKSWLQSLTQLIPTNITHPEYQDIKIKIIQSGPAWTLKITGDFILPVLEISVDLVGAIELHRWPNKLKKRPWFNDLIAEDKLCMLIPKAPDNSSKKGSNTPVKEPNIEKDQKTRDKEPNTTNYWRVSLPRIEKKLLHGKECVKPLIKLFKVFRDKQNWKNLASYFIKTIFLWELDKHLDDSTYWSNGNMEARFFEMLTVLLERFKTGVIPNFFFPEHNLANKIKRSTFDNMTNRLQIITNDIKKNPETAFKHFTIRKVEE